MRILALLVAPKVLSAIEYPNPTKVRADERRCSRHEVYIPRICSSSNLNFDVSSWLNRSVSQVYRDFGELSYWEPYVASISSGARVFPYRSSPSRSKYISEHIPTEFVAKTEKQEQLPG